MPLDFAVDEMFKFQDATTVFTGRLIGESPYLKPCRADLLIEDVVSCSLDLDGEMMPYDRADSNVRSVSTRDRLSISSDSFPKGTVFLRLHGCKMFCLRRNDH